MESYSWKISTIPVSILWRNLFVDPSFGSDTCLFFLDEHGVTAFGTPTVNGYAGRLVTVIMAFFLLVANILLLNLLIAIFK